MFDGTKRKLSSFGIAHFESIDIEISGLCADSRMIKPGFLFAALRGFNLHGADYYEEAIIRGCSVILTDSEGQSQIKKLSKDHLVQLAKLLDIVFYRGRFRMKAEDATKDNLINKIMIEKKNKALENQRMAISVTEDEILSLFGDSKLDNE